MSTQKDAPAEARQNGWHVHNGYHLWTHEYPLDAPALSIFERRSEGVLRIPDDPRLLRVIPAGTPHRVAHLFGFWRISDGDTLFMRTQGDKTVSYAMVIATQSPLYREDHVVFVCPQCDRELRKSTFPTGKSGLLAFWDDALARVRSFDGDVAWRRCGTCGFVHPYAYGLDANADTEAEHTARAMW